MSRPKREAHGATTRNLAPGETEVEWGEPSRHGPPVEGSPTVVDGGMCACPVAHEGRCTTDTAAAGVRTAEVGQYIDTPKGRVTAGEWRMSVNGVGEPFPYRVNAIFEDGRVDFGGQMSRDGVPFYGNHTEAERVAAMPLHEEAPAPDHPAVPPPSPADLTAAILGAMADVDIYTREAQEAHERIGVAKGRLSEAIDAKARSVGRGNVCTISGVLYRATAPRRKRGASEDPAALWTLEKVEVRE